MRGSLILYLACLGLLAAGLRGQASDPTNTPGVGRLAPPPLPSASSPVDVFRQLLALSATEREQALASRQEKARQYLQDRLREFDQLSATERELRLQLLELQWYLLPLIKMAPPDRQPRLATVPARLRALVAERLTFWDQLPREHQRELLLNAAALQGLPGLGSRSAPPREPPMPEGLPSESRTLLETGLDRWRALPGEQRQRITANFNRLFDLNDRQKQRGLSGLSPAHRLQVQRMLASFAALPADQRGKCMQAFNRFAHMTEEERRHFLDNAARWKAMSAEEQQVWRMFTVGLPPALPGLDPSLPVPPSLPRPPAPRLVAPTNTQAAR